MKQPVSYTAKKPFSWPYSTFLEGGFESDLARECQVIAIPKPVLIDGEGKIIALDAEVREEKLGEQLAQLFGE